MGAGASVKRSPASMREEIDRLRERELNTKEEHVKEWDKEDLKVTAKLSQLQAERNELAQRLAEAEASLAHQKEGWRREKNRTMALTYSGLPLSLLSEGSMDLLERRSITKSFPMVTIAQSDVVGFSSLVTRLKPQEVIRIVDHVHALVEEAYSSEEIFIMEKSSDGCIAVAGLVETLKPERTLTSESMSSLSLADSSYGSQNYLLDYDKDTKQKQGNDDPCKTASYFASLLATAVLNLMSASTKINVPIGGGRQLQLRVGLHSGPCLAGVQGLQTSTGSSGLPQFKLMGPTTKHVNSLCRTGLALQVRVSKQCKDLLTRDEAFIFERCPDYMASAGHKSIESYWLVGKSDLPLNLPSLDLAISLSEYEDTDI